ELLREGVGLNRLRDPWGKPYIFEFGINNAYFTVNVKSAGPDGRFEIDSRHAGDDFIVWRAMIDSFQDTRAKLDDAISKYFRAASRVSGNENELAQALSQVGIDWASVRDPWGHRCYATFRSEARYIDQVTIQSYARYNETPKQKTEITSIPEQVNYIFVRSAGADGKEGTEDDFNLTTLSRIAAESAGKSAAAKVLQRASTVSGATGAITGSVADSNDAVIANTKIIATNKASSISFETQSRDDGRYSLINLPAGLYEVQFHATGFSRTVFTDVPVFSSNITLLNATLSVGAVSEMVTVAAGGAPIVETSQSQISRIAELPLNGRNSLAKLGAGVVTKPGGISTPRLREYFPETLVWQPSIETDAQGRAQLKFKLADNITTWKVGVVASTIDGEIGLAEKELRAFQPFFIEHDPPRVLTEGDEIMLPVVLRNYLDKSQAVDLEIKPEKWFALLGPSRKRSEIAPGDSTRELFGFRAIAPMVDGRQRITATGEESDSIEKPISVHPDGQEMIDSASQVFNDSGTLELTIPATAITNTTRAELKIYPNLMAHIFEGVEAIMQRPYGCAEQTISSTYPSLMVLRYHGRRAEDFPAIAERARRYLQAGYERLLNYRNENGGFSYWGRGDADLALTGYALRFLNDARELIAIDEDVIQETREWLIKQQRQDGSWPAHSWSVGEDKTRTLSLTSFIARVLASATKTGGDKT
ncbi:MAG TPA: alpha-2-macroglobulin family protein, partial [Blastocatellia bacterium]|nr:alpha-2-macroglobulin family protein [Blastocatellia bacterium]